MNKLSNWLIVLATVSVAVLPVVAVQFQAEMARWYLAAAANSVAMEKDGDGAFLERALAVYPDVEKLRDYWLLRVKQALTNEPADVPGELLGAVAVDADYVDLCDYAAPRLWSGEMFLEFVAVLELKRSLVSEFSIDELNQLAYARSLVGVDLDAALADINVALNRSPKNYAYRDTRAWVLFQMGRPLEALDDANFAIREVERLDAVNAWLGWLEPDTKVVERPESTDEVGTAELTAEAFDENLDSAKEEQADFEESESLSQLESSELQRVAVSERLWGMGAIYYHRARILEALGREAEAEKDWQWLKSRNLPVDGSLY